MARGFGRGRRAIVGAGVAAILALTACGSGEGQEAGGAGSPRVPAPAAPVVASPTPTCAKASAKEALAAAMPKVPTVEGDREWDWDPENAFTDDYDPCATLSWIPVGIVGPTGSSPYHVLLFHRGAFVGTATKTSQAFSPATERISDSALTITYMFPRGGEANAGASGKATSTFTWDDAKQQVVRTGELPPGEDSAAPVSEAGDATPSKGVPADSTPITTIRPAGQYGSETAVIVSPSGNIGCDFSADSGGCGVKSYVEVDDGSPFGPPWWFGLDGSSKPEVGARGDAPYFSDRSFPAQVVAYGQTVHYRNYVCHSAQDGMTCWNADTGHGVRMARSGYRTF